MKELRWDPVKSARLKKTRGMTFEEIVIANLIDVQAHSKSNQKLWLFEVKGYIWVVPCVETEYEIFFKTLYPSRKHTKLFKGDLI